MSIIVQRMLLGVLAGLITAGATAAAITRTVTGMVCGSIDMTTSFITGLVVVFTGDTRSIHTPAGCPVPVTGIRFAAAGVALVVFAVVAVVVVLWWRWKQSDQYFIWEMRGRSGFAKRWELRKHSSKKAMLARATTIRPTLKNPSVEDVAWRIGRSNGQDVYVSAEDSIVLEGPPRQGKGFRVLIAAIIDWAGPLITTSTRSDNLTTTMRARQAKGIVSVFDPQGLSGISGALKVDPTDGCQDPLVAVQRAEAILAGTALGQSSSNREWASASAGIMSRLLHAAAVSGGGVDQLYAWGASPQHATEAADILDVDGTPGWADELRGVIEDDPKLRSSMWMGVKEAVKPLAIPTIRESMKPGRGNRFDPDAFLSGQNTLYLIGTGSGAGAVGGFLGAVLDDIVERARTRAMVSAGGRLEMPLGLVLDEIVNMFVWKALPTLMADGGGIGISPLVVVQAMSQAKTAWSEAEASSIWSAATAKILLGGAGDPAHLRDVEALLGTRKVNRSSSTYSDTGDSSNVQSERVPVMTVDELRRMPEQMGLLAYKNRRGILLDLEGWIRRSDADQIRTGKQETSAEQLATFRRQTGGVR